MTSADLGLLSPVWAGTEAEASTGDAAFVQALLDAEAALTRAVAPAEVAARVTAACRADAFDIRDLALRATAGGNPVIPLVGALRAAVGPADAEWVHRGATSQDILDTALMLAASRTVRLVLADLTRTAAALAGLAAAHRDTPMPGRTLTQHAVPTTFGLKAAGWRCLVLDAHDRLTALRLPAQLGGAAGTLAAFAAHEAAARGGQDDRPDGPGAGCGAEAGAAGAGAGTGTGAGAGAGAGESGGRWPTAPDAATAGAPAATATASGRWPTAPDSPAAAGGTGGPFPHTGAHPGAHDGLPSDTSAAAPHGETAGSGLAGPGLVAAYARETGLAEPLLPWHTLRTPVADLAAALAFTTGALGKVAADVLTLSRTEIGEVAEGGGGGSSAMPHKANPVRATLMATAARQAPGLAAVLLGSLVAEDERPAGAWHAEWQPLRELLRLAGGAAHAAAELAEHLRVFPYRMIENLGLTEGLIVSERIAVELAPLLGAGRAKALLTTASKRATAEACPLADSLADVLSEEEPGVTLSKARLGELTDPAHYTGAAPALTDRALRRAPARPTSTP